MRARAGFTLIETIVSLLLSSVIIVLVASTFLVQNQYYATQILRTGAHDNARASTELITAELRSIGEGGILSAGARTLSIRTPIMLLSVCHALPNTWYVHSAGGEAAIDTAEIRGVAKRDTLSGAWTYATTTWNSLNGSDVGAAQRCYSSGADTVGSRDDFHELGGLASLVGAPIAGDVLMLFRETTYTIQTSGMDPSSLGLFRRAGNGTAVEYATGFASTAQFKYRTAAGTYVDTVAAAGLSSIDVVRLIADAEKPAPTGGADDVAFGWSVNVALRNVR